WLRLASTYRRVIWLSSNASTASSALSLHDALPISAHDQARHIPAVAAAEGDELAHARADARLDVARLGDTAAGDGDDVAEPCNRSEEHTSELQSRENLVCRLLLEKKKHSRSRHYTC